MTADVLFFAVRNRIKSEERGSRGPIFLRLKVDPDLGSRPNLRHPVFPLQIKKMGDTGFEEHDHSSEDTALSSHAGLVECLTHKRLELFAVRGEYVKTSGKGNLRE